MTGSTKILTVQVPKSQGSADLSTPQLVSFLNGFTAPCKYVPVLEANPDICFLDREPHFGQIAVLLDSLIGRFNSNSVLHLEQRYS